MKYDINHILMIPLPNQQAWYTMLMLNIDSQQKFRSQTNFQSGSNVKQASKISQAKHSSVPLAIVSLLLVGLGYGVSIYSTVGGIALIIIAAFFGYTSNHAVGRLIASVVFALSLLGIGITALSGVGILLGGKVVP